MNTNSNDISVFKITFMVVGTILGAGFASGRELWVYFGSFGTMGYVGLVILGLSFAVVCAAGAKLANKLGRSDFGEVIIPDGHPLCQKIIGVFLSFVVWTVLVTMTAAGTSVAIQQFNMPNYVGGIIVAVLCVLTVFGDFERVSKVFGYVMPVLMVVIIATCVVLLFIDIPELGYTDIPKHSALAPNWFVSAIVYVCFNMTGPLMLSIIIGNRYSDYKTVRKGIFIGAVFVVILAILMITVELKDPSFSEAMDMPLLGYSVLINRPMNIIFALVLMCAIYSAATSNFYAFTTKLPDNKYKKVIITISTVIAYSVGMVGFKNIVNYMFSILGILEIGVIILLFVNYYLVFKKKKA